MKQRLGLCLEPLDVLFFRDSRPFNAGMRGMGGLPLPQTLAGAVRTHLWRHLGFDFENLARQLPRIATGEDDITATVASLLPPAQAWAATIKIRGPWLCITTSAGAMTPLVSAPADLVTLGKKNTDGPIERLHPIRNPPPGWRAPGPGIVPFWYRGSEVVERAQGYLTLEGLRRYLNGEDLHKEHRYKPQDLYTWEDRVGIAINADRNRAEDQFLYAVRLLRLHQGTAFYAEVEAEVNDATQVKGLLSGTMAFGGEGRRVCVTVLAQPVNWPKASVTGDGTLVVLITPGIFGVEQEETRSAPPWRPDPSLGTLVAVSVSGARSISGWDLARRRPKPTRQAVTEGSVYCFSNMAGRNSDSPFLSLNSGHLDAIGYGLALQGVWKYA